MKTRSRILPVLTGMLLLAACTGSVSPIVVGKDACDHCRMTIMDARFAAEWLSEKGKPYKFDDLRCAKAFLAEGTQKGGEVWVMDWTGANPNLIKAGDAAFVQHESLSTPMAGGAVAFSGKEAAQKTADSLGTKVISWAEVN